MREPPSITEEDLLACLQDQYHLSPITLTFLPLGRDYDAGIYRVESEQGTAYALKVTTRSFYEPCCLVPRYLNDQGITSVVAPIRTKSNTLWARLSDWTVIVYPWISGESSLTGMTDEQWKQLGTIFQRIHQVPLPPGGFASLHKETFDPTEYVRLVRAFENQYDHAQDENAVLRALRSSWVAHQSTIQTVVTSLQKLAAVLQSRPLPYVICHGDLHARNLIRTQAGQVFVVDWDEVMLAPKERDFIFVWPPHAGTFFQGCGQAEIELVALTYFLWERVVQDLIECTHNVLFRDEWGEESRMEAIQLLDIILAEDRGRINAAFQASAHLPGDFTVHRGQSS